MIFSKKISNLIFVYSKIIVEFKKKYFFNNYYHFIKLKNKYNFRYSHKIHIKSENL